MEWVTIVIVWCFVVGQVTNTKAARFNDGHTFHLQLAHLANDVMGLQEMQSILDNANFKSMKLDGHTAVEKLTSKLSRKFKTTFEAVSKIKNHLEGNYGSFKHKTNFLNCCGYPTHKLEYYAQTNNKVNTNDLCYSVSKDAKHNVTIPASKELLRIFKENLNNGHSIQAQYFGSEDGVIVGFPAENRGTVCSQPGTYDARYRPWYVETATPIPKDIVVVLDRSGTMSLGQSMKMAKDAAKTVVGTLNPKDRIGVVVFSDEAYTPPGSDDTSSCFGRQLAYATSDNTNYLLGYLDSIKAYGGTNYMSALEKAFGLLRNSPATSTDTRKRRKAIIFLTDGRPGWASPKRILQLIADRNAELGNEVMILTYAFGKEMEIDLEAQALLRNMSRQILSNRSMGDITPGDLKLIDSLDRLRISLGSYYNFFSGFDLLKIPIVTSPYISNYNVGLVLSVCLPVHHVRLQGVASVDISLADLLEDVAYFRHGENSYAFIIDGTGRTFMHPKVPSLFQTKTKRPTFYDISGFEPHEQAKSVIDSMRRGDKGFKRFRTQLVQSRGDPRRNGFYSKTAMANYFWRPVVGTNFSVCIVFTDTDRRLSSNGKKSARNFLYHRLDLRRPTKVCRIGASMSTLMHSSVKFSGAAFRNAYKYFNKKEDGDTVRRYENYMKGEGASSTVFRGCVRDMVAVTEQVDTFWKQTNSPSILRRYAGFSNGVFREFPASILPTNYEPTTRHWYQSAMAQRGSLVLTTPYRSQPTGKLVITLARVLYQGKVSGDHSKKDMVIGVMGLDVKVQFLEQLLNKVMPACTKTQTRCFIVDTSGYLVYHEDFTRKDSGDSKFIHIIQKEPDIARDLIRKGLMKRKTCTSFSTKDIYYTWQLESGGVNSSWPKYSLQFVPETNIYLGIKSVSQSIFPHCDSCPSEGDNQATYRECEHWDDADACQCPCHVKSGYEYCNNRFPHISSSNPACPPEPPVMPTQREDAAVQSVYGLSECYQLNCEERDESDCATVFGCSWCGSGSTGSCFPESQCIGSTANGHTVAEYIGAVIGCLVIIALLIMTALYIGKNRRSEFIVMSNESVTKVPNREARRLPIPTDNEHVYETIRQLQMDMAARGGMRDRTDTGESGYLHPAAVVSPHPTGSGQVETAFDARATISTITTNAPDVRTSPDPQRLRRGGSEDSLAHTPSDDFVWM